MCNSQLPCAITELRTSLTYVEVKDLPAAVSALQSGISQNWPCAGTRSSDDLGKLLRVYVKTDLTIARARLLVRRRMGKDVLKLVEVQEWG